MSGKEYHRVHSSLITEPKIAGVTKGVFGIEVIAALLMFNYFRVHIMSAILIGIIFFVIHPIIRNVQKKDPLSVQLWFVSALTSQGYFPAKEDINRPPRQAKKSIPKHS